MKLTSTLTRLTVAFMVLFSQFSGAVSVFSQTTEAHLFVDPASSTANTCGTQTIAIGVEDVVDLTAFELRVDFDPTVVEITAVENGGFLVAPGEPAFYSPDNNDGDWNTDGFIHFGMAQEGDGTGDPTPVSGAGDLITITFKALEPNSSVDFEIDPALSMLVDWPDAFEIPFTVTNGTVTTESCAPTDIALSNNTVLELQPIGTTVGTLTTTDPDASDTTFTYSLVDTTTYPDNAAFSITGDQLLTAEMFNYDDKNTYTIKVRTTDPWGETYDEVFTIDVTWVPIATADSYQIKENGSLVLTAPGVLGNDYAPADYVSSLTAQLVTGLTPGTGTLALNSDGSLVYVPPTDWKGEASFTYRACATGLCSEPVTVSIEVRQVPVAVNDSYSTYVDQPLTIAAPGVLTNDTLGEDPSLTANLVTGVDPLEGSVTLSPDGSFTFTPATGFIGETSFTYRACDTVFCSAAATVTITVVDVPVANDDNYVTPQDETLTIAAPGVLSNDSGPAGETLIAVIETDLTPGTGSLTLGSNGSLTYIPPAGWTGSTSFTYKACYDSVCSVPATVTIEVKEVPVAVADSYEVPENGSLSVPTPGVLGNDTAPTGVTLTAVLVSDIPGGEGTLVFNADGSFDYTPPADWTGSTSFTYQACYDGICSDPVTVTLEVKQVPVATVDDYEMAKNTTLTISTPGVLGNDTGGVGATLTAALVSDVASGTLVLNANGSFTYTPTTDWTGTDSFTYKACDGTICSTPVTVTIVVKAVPVAVNDSYLTVINQALVVDAASGVLANDTAPVDAIAVLVDNVPSAAGGLTFNADGSFTYTPTTDWIGTTSFTYKVCDGTICSTAAMVTIQVKDIPVAVDDDYETLINQTLTVTAPGVLGNDLAPTGVVLTAALIADVPVDDGTLTFNSDGSFSFVPTTDWTGTTSFTYQACDGTVCSNTATVTIEVKGIPVAVDDDYDLPVNGVLNISAPGVLGNDTGPTGVTLTATLVSGIPTGEGTLALDSDGSFIYLPPSGWIGSTSFTYRACYDGICSDPATVSIDVKQVPVALDDAYELPEDGSLTVGPLDGVLANDTAGAGATLTAVLVSDIPTGEGTLTLNLDGSFTYDPPAGWTGSTSFTYQACDGSVCSAAATVTIEVKEIPVAVDDDYETPINVTLNESAPGVLGNDTAPDGVTLTAALVDDVPAADGTLTLNPDGSFDFAPATDFVGETTFTYQACDGTVCSTPATVTIAVKVVPTAVADSYETPVNVTLNEPAPGVLENDTAPTGVILTAVLVDDIPTGEGDLTLNADGSLAYIPPTDWVGSTSFTYKACDGTVCSTPVTVTIDVKDVAVAVDDDYETPVNVTLNESAPGVLENDTAPVGATLTAVLVDDVPTGEGSLTLNSDGSFEFIPTTDWSGSTTFTYKACDGTVCSAPATVTIEVKVVPTAVADDYETPVNVTLNVADPGVLSNDLAPIGVSLTAELVSDVPTGEGTLTFNADGSFDYTPPADWVDSTTFTYKACDGTVCSEPVTVTIEVKEVPVAVADSYELPEEGSLVVNAADGVLANDTAAVGVTLTAVLASDIPDGEGSLTLNTDGSFSYTPPAGWSGTTSFTYQACDGTVCSAPVTVTIVVKEVPVAVNDAYDTPINVVLNVAAPGVLTNDTAPIGVSLTAELVTDIPPAQGALTFNADGSLSYTPLVGWTGTTSFTYRACDGTVCSEPATVSISVKQVPVAADDDYEVAENSTLTVLPADGVLINDSGAVGATLTTALVTDIPSGEGSLTLDADGGFTYTPLTDFVGSTSFTYKACDGTVCSAPATVTIVVKELPVATDDDYFTPENTVLNVVAAGVLANDTGPVGVTLAAVLVDDIPTGEGSLTLNANGSFDYTPPTDWVGTTTFTYRACYESVYCSTAATVTIDVLGPPEVVDDDYVMLMNKTLDVAAPGVLGNDTGPIGETLLADLVTDVPTGEGDLTLHTDGSFEYTPPEDWFGTTSFSYRACYGLICSDLATVTITVLESPCIIVEPWSIDHTMVPNDTDTLDLTVTNTCSQAVDFEILEKRTVSRQGFEAGVMPPPGGWEKVHDGTTANQWTVVHKDSYPDYVDDGNLAAWVRYDDNNPSDEWLISPVFDTSSLSDLVLSFSAYSDTKYPGATVKVWVLDTNEDPLTAEPLWDLIRDEDWTVTDYRRVTVDLSEFDGYGLIRVAWQYVGQAGQSFGLDNVDISRAGGMPWLSETPLTGSIPAGSSQDITVTFNTTGLTVRNYFGSLFVGSDPRPGFGIPVTLRVVEEEDEGYGIYFPIFGH